LLINDLKTQRRRRIMHEVIKALLELAERYVEVKEGELEQKVRMNDRFTQSVEKAEAESPVNTFKERGEQPQKEDPVDTKGTDEDIDPYKLPKKLRYTKAECEAIRDELVNLKIYVPKNTAGAAMWEKLQSIGQAQTDGKEKIADAFLPDSGGKKEVGTIIDEIVVDEKSMFEALKKYGDKVGMPGVKKLVNDICGEAVPNMTAIKEEHFENIILATVKGYTLDEDGKAVINL
jgi:hypothetical protein